MDKESKEKELSELNQRIAQEIEKTNLLQAEINEKTEKLVNFNLQLIEAKTFRNEALFSTQLPKELNMKDFPQDYIDHIREKNDEMTKLQSDLETSKETVNNRTTEITNLIEKRLDLMCKLTKTNFKVYKQELENINLKKTQNLYQSHLKEYDILIKEAEQIKNKTETALSTTIKITDNYEFVSGGEIDIKNTISNAKEQIKKIDEKLTKGLTLLTKYQNEDFDEQNKFNQNMNNLKTLYSFDSQFNEGNSEFQNMKQNIQDMKQNLQNLKDAVDLKEKRLTVLFPITEKHKKSKVLTVQIQPNSTVDQLIQKLASSEKNCKKFIGSKIDSLSLLIKQNSMLEKKIEARYREFEIMLNKYKVDQQVLKRRIEETRSFNYEREHEILETIKKTEIKVHENIQKSISSTKPRKQNFSTFLLESPGRRTINYSEM